MPAYTTVSILKTYHGFTSTVGKHGFLIDPALTEAQQLLKPTLVQVAIED